MITDLSTINPTIRTLVANCSGVPEARVILSNQGRPSPEGLDVYATYKPIPVRAYGHSRHDRTLTPAVGSNIANWEDYDDLTVTQMDFMISVNFLNSGAREAALRMHNANFRPSINEFLYENEIGWRYTSDVRRLTEVLNAGLQSRYQVDVNIWLETAVSETVLRAAGFSFDIEDRDGNTLAIGAG